MGTNYLHRMSSILKNNVFKFVCVSCSNQCWASAQFGGLESLVMVSLNKIQIRTTFNFWN